MLLIFRNYIHILYITLRGYPIGRGDIYIRMFISGGPYSITSLYITISSRYTPHVYHMYYDICISISPSEGGYPRRVISAICISPTNHLLTVAPYEVFGVKLYNPPPTPTNHQYNNAMRGCFEVRENLNEVFSKAPSHTIVCTHKFLLHLIRFLI